MTISQAIEDLMRLRDKHGDIEVVTDCEHCGKSTAPSVIVTGPPVARLQTTPSTNAVDPRPNPRERRPRARGV